MQGILSDEIEFSKLQSRAVHRKGREGRKGKPKSHRRERRGPQRRIWVGMGSKTMHYGIVGFLRA
jgi:hypothetical protein